MRERDTYNRVPVECIPFFPISSNIIPISSLYPYAYPYVAPTYEFPYSLLTPSKVSTGKDQATRDEGHHWDVLASLLKVSGGNSKC